MKRVKEGAKWTWSALRPGAVIGFSLVRSCLIFSPPVHLTCTPCKHDVCKVALLIKLLAQPTGRQSSSVSNVAIRQGCPSFVRQLWRESKHSREVIPDC